MLNAEYNTKLNQIFHKALYWKAAAFGTLCIQQEYQVYEQLAKGRFWDMSTHLKKTVKRFWRAVTTGYAMDDKYLLIVEESFFEPRDACEVLALQIVQDILDLYYAEATLEISQRQFDLLEKYCALVGEKLTAEHSLAKRTMEQQISWAEELASVAKQDKAKTLEYYSLAAGAARDCIKALREGKKAIGWDSHHINCVLEKESSMHYYVKSAVLSGNYDMALEIVTADSIIGAMILGEDERAKKYLPEEFEQIDKYDRDWDGTLWAILHGDEKLMNHCIKDYIKTLRWQAKNFNSIDLIAVFALPLIRLGMDRGMKCTLNVYELPLELLDGDKEFGKSL